MCGATDRAGTGTWYRCVDGKGHRPRLDATNFTRGAARQLQPPEGHVQPLVGRPAEVPGPEGPVAAPGSWARKAQPVNLAVRGAGTSALMGLARATVVGGLFSAYVPRGHLRGAAQQVFWFVDSDRDGLCDAGERGGVVDVSGADGTSNDPIEVDAGGGDRSAVPARPACVRPFPKRGTFDLSATGFEENEGFYLKLTTRAGSGGALAHARAPGHGHGRRGVLLSNGQLLRAGHAARAGLVDRRQVRRSSLAASASGTRSSVLSSRTRAASSTRPSRRPRRRPSGTTSAAS
jgi:hypothetical protein